MLEIGIVCEILKFIMAKRQAFPWRWSQRRWIRILCRSMDGSSVHDDGGKQFLKPPIFFPHQLRICYIRTVFFLVFRRKIFPYFERSYWASQFVYSFIYEHQLI
jgi:hypothetical protein